MRIVGTGYRQESTLFTPLIPIDAVINKEGKIGFNNPFPISTVKMSSFPTTLNLVMIFCLVLTVVDGKRANKKCIDKQKADKQKLEFKVVIPCGKPINWSCYDSPSSLSTLSS